MSEIKIVSVDIRKPGGFLPFIKALENVDKINTFFYGAVLANRAEGLLLGKIHNEEIIIEYILIPSSDYEEMIFTALIDKVKEAALLIKAQRIRASFFKNVTADFGRFYEKCGFIKEENYNSYSFRLGFLLKGPLGKNIKVSKKVISIERVTKPLLNEFAVRLKSLTDGSVLDRISDVDRDLSFAIIEEGKITGLLLIAGDKKGLIIRALFGNGSLDTMLLLQSALASAQKKIF